MSTLLTTSAPRTPRSSWSIAMSVWKALFLREALSRLFASRTSWFWLFAEPVLHMAYLMFMFTVIRVRSVGGIETAIFVLVGLIPFFLFRRVGTQVANAVAPNRPLFAYRQVKPIDALLVRGVLEAMLLLVIGGLVLFGTYLWGYKTMPADPLAVAEGMFGLWLLGMGYGLITSVALELVPGIGRLLGFIMMPLYFVSGVMYPISRVPQPYRDWLLLNPIPHGLESVRLGFAPYYHAVPELDLAYLYEFALVTVFLGLALHRRFARRLLAK